MDVNLYGKIWGYFHLVILQVVINPTLSMDISIEKTTSLECVVRDLSSTLLIFVHVDILT